MLMTMFRTTVAAIALMTMVVLAAAPISDRLLAQEATPTTVIEEVPPTPTPLPTPTGYPLQGLGFTLIGQAGIQIESQGSVIASAATLTLPPGTASLEFTAIGPTIIAVQTGGIVVDSDAATVNVVDLGVVIGIYPSAGTPGPVDSVTAGIGQQVVLPAGATAVIRNDSDAPATVLVLSIIPGTEP